jgi:PRTRC genetic system protein A
MTGADPRDLVLQAHTPTLMVPRFGALPRLDKSGHRFLAAKYGLYLEVCRPWLYLCTPIGFFDIELPYGELEEMIEYAWADEEIAHLQYMFAYDAREAMPNECAAWGVWDEARKELVYRPLLAIHAAEDEVKFHRPPLADHEHLAIDIHSHAAGEPGFSPQDDEDDQGEVKFAVVGGRFHALPSFKSRLCAHGIFLPEGE